MKKKLIFCLVALTVSGCTTQTNQQSPYVAAREVYEKSALIEVPGHKNGFRLTYGNDPALERAFNHYAKSGKAANIVTDGSIKFAFNGAQQPVIKTTPFQETVISLQPGEKFTNVSSGDPNRWSYSVAVSGSGAHQQQNILVKPSLPDISTNMVITTDKRIYNIKLISSMDAKSSSMVSFWYPEEMIRSLNNEILKEENGTTIASVPDVSLNNLNFNYSMSADGVFKSMPSWKPTRVFDDGTHTYIQFPASIANKDIPVLFVTNGSKKELVNYRYKQPYFVVDKIFKQAMLVMGAGSSQTKVIVSNNCYN